MSSDITPDGVKDQLILTSFWGGDERGTCLQITPLVPARHFNADVIQLTHEQAMELTAAILKWAIVQEMRKQKG